MQFLHDIPTLPPIYSRHRKGPVRMPCFKANGILHWGHVNSFQLGYWFSVADPGGSASAHPQWDPILLLCTYFFQKAPTLEVGTLQWVSVPTIGNPGSAAGSKYTRGIRYVLTGRALLSMWIKIVLNTSYPQLNP